MDIRKKFAGVIIGSSLGDAIGKCVEDITKYDVYEFYGGPLRGFVEPHPMSPAHGRKPEETSDETTIFRLLLESILERKEIDVQDFIKRLITWYEDESSHRYPDPALLTAIDLLSRGSSPALYGLTSASVEGILRSVAVGMYHYYNPLLAAEGSRVVSLLTHRSEYISAGSAVLGALISMLLSDYDIGSIDGRIELIGKLQRISDSNRLSRVLDKVKELLINGADVDTAIFELGNGSFVLESLPLSIFIFLSHADDPQEAFWHGVNSYGEFGGDTDSIGFMVGAFVGAKFGLDVFPRELVDNLENSGYYINIANKLMDIIEESVRGG